MATIIAATPPNDVAKIASRVCSRGGFPEKFLYESMRNYCSEGEVSWVAGYRKSMQHPGGLCLVGEWKQVDSRFMAIAAAFSRNYITARVVSLFHIASDFEEADEQYGSCPVVLIPNFFLPTHGKQLTGWQSAGVHDFLLSRLSRDKRTVLYVKSLDGLVSFYGDNMPDFIKDNYLCLEAPCHT